MADWDGLQQRAQERYEDGEARLPDDPDARQKQLTRMGNAAGAAGLDGADGGSRRPRVVRPRRRALPRELGARAARKLGPPDRRDQGADPRGRLGRRRRRRALGARGRRRRGRVADRPLRRRARVRRARRVGRRRACTPTTPARTRRSRSEVADALAFIAAEDVRRLRRGRRGRARVVRDPRRVPRGHPGRGHGARAPGARRPPRHGDRARVARCCRERPVLLYDGGCRFCRFAARVVARLDFGRLAFLPFDDPAAEPLLARLPEAAASRACTCSDPTAPCGARAARPTASSPATADRLGRLVPSAPGPRRYP